MRHQLTAEAALDRYFLETRCKLIEIAATMDRIQRGKGSATIKNDPRLAQIRSALDILRAEAPQRAQQCQMAFSLPHDETWSPPNAR